MQDVKSKASKIPEPDANLTSDQQKVYGVILQKWEQANEEMMNFEANIAKTLKRQAFRF